MSDVRTQSIVTACWGALSAGAGLYGFGLLRGLVRRHSERSNDAIAGAGEGEIVLGAGKLEPGLRAELTVTGREANQERKWDHSGSIEAVTRGSCVVRLDCGAPGRCTAHWSANGHYCACGEPLPQAGAQVTGTVTAAGALYRFSSRLQDIGSAGDSVSLVLARPTILMRIQRRRDARVGIVLPATFECVWSPDPFQSPERPASRGGRALHGTVRDLSGGGLRGQIGGVLDLRQIDSLLETFRPDAIVRVCLPFPASERNTFTVRVLSSARTAVPGGLTVQVACAFLPMSEWEHESILTYVMLLQRDAAGKTGFSRLTRLEGAAR
jgi:hypothetical protein